MLLLFLALYAVCLPADALACAMADRLKLYADIKGKRIPKVTSATSYITLSPFLHLESPDLSKI